MAGKTLDAEIVVADRPQEQANPASDLGAIAEFMRDCVKKMKFGREFALVHVPDQGPHSIIYSVDFDPKVTIAEMERGCQALAQQLYDRAVHAMRVHTMPQVFNIVPYDRQHPEKQPMGAFPIRLWPPHSNMTGIGGMSESPTEAGVSKQAMRLTEVFSGQAYRTTRDGQDLLHGLLSETRDDLKAERVEWRTERKDLLEEIRKLRADHEAVLKAREEALDGSLMREVARKKAEQEQQNVGRMWDAAFTVGPMLLQAQGLPPELLSMFGKSAPPALPAANGASSASLAPLHRLHNLFQVLSGEEKAAIFGALSPEKKVELLQIMVAVATEIESGVAKKNGAATNGVAAGAGVGHGAS